MHHTRLKVRCTGEKCIMMAYHDLLMQLWWCWCWSMMTKVVRQRWSIMMINAVDRWSMIDGRLSMVMLDDNDVWWWPMLTVDGDQWLCWLMVIIDYDDGDRWRCWLVTMIDDVRWWWPMIVLIDDDDRWCSMIDNVTDDVWWWSMLTFVCIHRWVDSRFVLVHRARC